MLCCQWVGQSAVLSVGRAECCVAKRRSPDPKGGRYCEQSCVKKKVFMVTNCPVHLFFCLGITYSLLCHLQMYLSLHLNSSTMASSLYAVHARRCCFDNIYFNEQTCFIPVMFVWWWCVCMHLRHICVMAVIM